MKTNLTVIAVTFVQIASGQTDPGKEIPQPPYLARLNVNMQWKASAELKTKRKEPATPEEARLFAKKDRLSPELQSLIAFKGEKGLHIVYNWAGGKKTDGYLVDGVYYMERNPNIPNSITLYDPSQDSSCPDYSRSDFPELHWVGSRSFIRTEVERGRRCYFYQLRDVDVDKVVFEGLEVETSPSEPAVAEPRVIQQVWIDVESKLPLKYDDGKYIYTYTYVQAPPSDITPPPAFQKWIDEMQRFRQSSR